MNMNKEGFDINSLPPDDPTRKRLEEQWAKQDKEAKEQEELRTEHGRLEGEAIFLGEKVEEISDAVLGASVRMLELSRRPDLPEEVRAILEETRLSLIRAGGQLQDLPEEIKKISEQVRFALSGLKLQLRIISNEFPEEPKTRDFLNKYWERKVEPLLRPQDRHNSQGTWRHS